LYKEIKAPGGGAASVQSEEDDNQSEDLGSVAANTAEVRVQPSSSSCHNFFPSLVATSATFVAVPLSSYSLTLF